ncbi:ABC transporter ATP-binding protein [Luteibaculum oceani]|uniref:ABC transporter ATP-binding protein n=1 Tax=Luteibaculum oceani TaxID=1294296 RepID=A0A5C6V0H8_9FLAO|nr:ATP-binding cassette domain-containing protein [Luteibaculum oceani]TXC78400.1 ABC transporter ATP-binding protein [Luteibaculum oceani]
MLTIKEVSKVYVNHKALNNVSFEVKEGEIFGLLGPNGAGKTTLIRIINQITAPDEGTVTLNGERLKPDHISQIGYLPEERGLYKKMTVGEQCMYLAQLKGMSQSEAKREIKKWFERFEIGSWWNKKVEELSKGMAQKLQFITTVVHQPKLIILDEPFSGFDPINTSLIKGEIMRLKKEGATIMLSTHNMGSVEEICDSFALINRSKKVLGGAVSEVKREFAPNAWEIVIPSESQINLPSFSTLTDEQSLAEGRKKLKIKLNEDKSLNNLLQELIPQAPIIAAQEVVPTMNDIFIEVVNANN